VSKSIVLFFDKVDKKIISLTARSRTSSRVYHEHNSHKKVNRDLNFFAFPWSKIECGIFFVSVEFTTEKIIENRIK
jgi:hypothetical protein